MKILIADDEAVSRHLLEKTLTPASYEVIAVENGVLAAEQLCRPDGPRLALLDWVMPELLGPDVCRYVRERRDQPYVYMVLLTSKESKQDVVAGLESGADDYLIKPFDPDELKARLRTGLRILQLEDKLVEAREGMRFKATHDPLTSLLNRGVIMELLSKELVRAQRDKSSITVLLGDLDHFKQVNDTYGHLIGSKLLAEIGYLIKAQLRLIDYAFRYGGDEFVVLLPQTGKDSALVVARRLRDSLRTSMFCKEEGLNLNVRASMGVATYPHDAKTPHDIIRQADEMMYLVKNTSRDNIGIAQRGVMNS